MISKWQEVREEMNTLTEFKLEIQISNQRLSCLNCLNLTVKLLSQKSFSLHASAGDVDTMTGNNKTVVSSISAVYSRFHRHGKRMHVLGRCGRQTNLVHPVYRHRLELVVQAIDYVR